MEDDRDNNELSRGVLASRRKVEGVVPTVSWVGEWGGTGGGTASRGTGKWTQSVLVKEG